MNITYAMWWTSISVLVVAMFASDIMGWSATCNIFSMCMDAVSLSGLGDLPGAPGGPGCRDAGVWLQGTGVLESMYRTVANR